MLDGCFETGGSEDPLHNAARLPRVWDGQARFHCGSTWRGSRDGHANGGVGAACAGITTRWACPIGEVSRALLLTAAGDMFAIVATVHTMHLDDG